MGMPSHVVLHNDGGGAGWEARVCYKSEIIYCTRYQYQVPVPGMQY